MNTTTLNMTTLDGGVIKKKGGGGGTPSSTLVTKKVSWLSRYGTNEQEGLTFDPAAMTYTGGESVQYGNKPLVLPLTSDAEWRVDFSFAKYTKGQFVGLNPNGAYNRLYIGTNASLNDIRFGFAFYFLDEEKQTGVKYFNFTSTGKASILLSGAHCLSLLYKKGKFFLSIDNGELVTFDKFIIGTQAASSVDSDDVEGITSKALMDFIKAQTGSNYLVFNGGGVAGSSGLGFDGTFKHVSASVTAKSEHLCGVAPAPTLFDKNVHFLGSSIFLGSKGSPAGNSFVDILNQRWGTSFKKEAVGGTTLAIRNGFTDSYCERYANFANKDKCDALVVQLSTNDFAKGVPVGDVTGNGTTIGQFDKTTICGAIEWLIATAKQNNPDVKVVFVSCPMLSTWTNYNEYKAFNNGLMQDLIEKWGIEFVDIFNDNRPWSNSNAYWSASTTTPTSTTCHLFYDAIHVNVEGYHLLMTPKVASKLIDLFAAITK